MKHRIEPLIPCAIGILLSMPATRSQEFYGLGKLPGAGHSYALAVSSGSNPVVVGQSGVHGFRWTRTEGMRILGGGYAYSSASDVSDDGTVIAGSHVYGFLFPGDDEETGAVRPCIWRNGQLIHLPFLPSMLSPYGDGAAHGVSGDGSVIVGECKGLSGTPEACRWLGGEVRSLGIGRTSQAFAVSARGDTVVGALGGLGGSGFRWSGELEILGPGAAFGVTADGNTVVGEGGRWTAGGGWEDFGGEGVVSDISHGGCVLVGGDEDEGPAGMWTPWTGPVELQALIEGEYGLDLGGWELDYADGVSGDGRAIVGQGVNPSGEVEAWLFLFPEQIDVEDADTDGDGLLNSWECSGIDADGDGTVDIDLPQMGANPLHRDLFVEVDLMSGVTFLPEARDAVIEAFAAAPVANPDGLTGVRLHIEVDETDLPPAGVWATVNSWPTAFDAYKSDRFGTVEERAEASVIAMKKKVFRYCLGIQKLDHRAGGVGEGPGNDFVICLGEEYFQDGENDGEEQAAVFMHELGHNLGLRHGGADDIVGKPNYVSLMNYVLSYRQRFSANYWKLDYSREKLPTLDEANLDEAAGIRSSGPYTRFWMPYGYNLQKANGEVVRANPANFTVLRLDGTPADFGRLIPENDGVLDRSVHSVGVRQDLNYLGASSPIGGTKKPTPGQMLVGHNDWANIQLPIPDPPNGNYQDAVHFDIPDDELSRAELQWIEQHFPDAPPECGLLLGIVLTADGRVTLSWPACEGVHLQRSASLKTSNWEDIPVSDSQNEITLSRQAGAGFFRLLKP